MRRDEKIRERLTDRSSVEVWGHGGLKSGISRSFEDCVLAVWIRPRCREHFDGAQAAAKLKGDRSYRG